MKTKLALELFALFAILCVARGDMTIQDELVVSVQARFVSFFIPSCENHISFK